MFVFEQLGVIFELYLPTKKTDFKQVVAEFCNEKAGTEGAT